MGIGKQNIYYPVHRNKLRGQYHIASFTFRKSPNYFLVLIDCSIIVSIQNPDKGMNILS